MQNKKPFLISHYGLQVLSADTGITTHKLSDYVNRKNNTSFNHYIKRYRVLHFIDKIEANEQQLKTLEALACKCGFKDRTTFNRAFKKVCQCTPAEYIRKSKK